MTGDDAQKEVLANLIDELHLILRLYFRQRLSCLAAASQQVHRPTSALPAARSHPHRTNFGRYASLGKIPEKAAEKRW